MKAAFLQGSELDRDVFVLPPKKVRVPGELWKMVKRAYGFIDKMRFLSRVGENFALSWL